MSEVFTRAGLLVRTVARILDFIIIAAAVELVPKAGFFAGLIYLLIGDGLFNGQSIGKKLVGLTVVSADSLQLCSIRDSILRNSIFAVGYLFFKVLWIGWILIIIIAALEFIVLLGSKDKMRIGDEFAKTIVIDGPQVKREE